jgi:RimJ/RimL family protein N-acetyltransferase
VREYAYRELGWRTLISFIAAENAPSRRVAQRLGASFERDMKIWTFTLGIYRHPGPDKLHS